MARVQADRAGPSRHKHNNGDKAAAAAYKTSKSSDGDAGSESFDFVPLMDKPVAHGTPQMSSGLPLQQVTVFGVAITVGLLYIVNVLGGADAYLHNLFHIYYQPVMVMVWMLWLWGADVFLFESRHIRYKVCFSETDQAYCLDSNHIFQMAGVLSLMVVGSACAFVHYTVDGQLSAAAVQPPLLLASLLLFACIPLHLLFRDTRWFFTQTVLRVGTPWREVTWADFLLADVLTSLAKPIADTGRAVCHIAAGPVMLPHSSDKACGKLSWIIPVGFCLPYAWRFCQCIRVYLDTGAKPQIFNAIKYSTAFPAVFLVATKDWVSPQAWRTFYRPLWLGAQLLNSSYSYFWDIERDWEIQFFTAPPGGPRVCGNLFPRPILKGELLFTRGFYYYLMVSNLALRLAWLHKLVPSLRHSHAAIMLFALLEAFRRAQWVPVRVEVELRKLQHQRPELGMLVPPSSPPASHEGLPLLDKHRPSI